MPARSEFGFFQGSDRKMVVSRRDVLDCPCGYSVSGCRRFVWLTLGLLCQSSVGSLTVSLIQVKARWINRTPIEVGLRPVAIP
ncbi:hypothetical protein BRAS3843_1490005 [Bradyrhizobium sp. STM 3843]|nr:hypothetical protein BRAS3843_1490005 [Bradyrhizobium sp. STM 3843]